MTCIRGPHTASPRAARRDEDERQDAQDEAGWTTAANLRHGDAESGSQIDLYVDVPAGAGLVIVERIAGRRHDRRPHTPQRAAHVLDERIRAHLSRPAM